MSHVLQWTQFAKLIFSRGSPLSITISYTAAGQKYWQRFPYSRTNSPLLQQGEAGLLAQLKKCGASAFFLLRSFTRAILLTSNFQSLTSSTVLYVQVQNHP
jgi:hypothetical protein